MLIRGDWLLIKTKCTISDVEKEETAYGKLETMWSDIESYFISYATKVSTVYCYVEISHFPTDRSWKIRSLEEAKEKLGSFLVME